MIFDQFFEALDSLVDPPDSFQISVAPWSVGVTVEVTSSEVEETEEVIRREKIAFGGVSQVVLELFYAVPINFLLRFSTLEDLLRVLDTQNSFLVVEVSEELIYEFCLDAFEGSSRSAEEIISVKFPPRVYPVSGQ